MTKVEQNCQNDGFIWLGFKSETKQKKNLINGIKIKHKMCVESSINSRKLLRIMSYKILIFLLIINTVVNQGFCHALNDGKSIFVRLLI